MTTPFLPYAKQLITDDDIQAVADSLRGELITRGSPVQKFEEEMARYCDAPYAVAFNSGTAALMASYFALTLSPSDKIVSTPNTFIATIGEPIRMGIKPVFVDIDRSTGNMDLNDLKEHLNFQSSRGNLFVVPIHFSGIAIDMKALDQQICNPKIFVIEDASHALGSFYPSGEKVGSCYYSQITIFSFHPAKLLTTGEGGLATTRDPQLFHRLKLFRDNGIERTAPYLKESEAPGYYEVHEITGNYNFTSFQAALGSSQFKRIEPNIKKRRALVRHYRKRLSKVSDLLLFSDIQDDKSAFALFVVQIDFEKYKKNRIDLIHLLKEKGIGSQVHYIPLYHHPVIKNKFGTYPSLPKTEKYYHEALSLPLYYDLTEKDVNRVCDTLLSILKN